jgi:hypothetical protein
MRPHQVQLAAELLDMDLQAAASRARRDRRHKASLTMGIDATTPSFDLMFPLAGPKV